MAGAAEDEEELLKEVTVAAPEDLEMAALSTDSKQPGNSGNKQQEPGKSNQSGTVMSHGSADKARNIVLFTNCSSEPEPVAGGGACFWPA